jgi:hypothetical protein
LQFVIARFVIYFFCFTSKYTRALLRVNVRLFESILLFVQIFYI